MRPRGAVEGDRAQGPTRTQRALVLGALGLLLVGGLAEVEAWPVTGWRLFSESRGAEQSGWSLRAVQADGTTATVVLADLPLGFRLAAWPLGEAGRAGSSDGSALCAALLDQVREAHPATVELRVVRTRRRLAPVDEGWWSVEVGRDEALRCARDGAP